MARKGTPTVAKLLKGKTAPQVVHFDTCALTSSFTSVLQIEIQQHCTRLLADAADRLSSDRLDWCCTASEFAQLLRVHTVYKLLYRQRD